jgi:uncharacterized protein YprB with RNaseH-like and TPR domain
MNKRRKLSAYLDIETTGLSPYSAELTVIGIHIENDCDEVIQMVGDDISPASLVETVRNVGRIYTYNGSRFDLPFIREKLNVDLTYSCSHTDLMYSCWRRDLKGGLKSVERQLGIARKLTDVDGWVAVQLWHEYKMNGCANSLERLLEYNKEDVLNLKHLRKILEAGN